MAPHGRSDPRGSRPAELADTCFPGLRWRQARRAGARVFWLGTREGIEAKLVPQHGVDFEGVSFRGVRGKGLRTLVLGPFALLGACLDARRIIRRRKPDVVLGFGGFASFPGGLMGTAAGKPLVLHDANAVAGLATRVLAYGADRILLGFPQALKGAHAKRVEWVGNPLRDRRLHAARARGALRRAQRPAAHPGRRRQPGRARAERSRARGHRANSRRRSGRWSSTRPERSTSRSCAKHMRATGRRRMRRVHRRHGGALCVGRFRDLPRRRIDRRRIGGGGPGRDRRAAAGRDRRRAERERAVPGRCRRRVEGAAGCNSRRTDWQASCGCWTARARARWRRRRMRSASATPPNVSLPSARSVARR